MDWLTNPIEWWIDPFIDSAIMRDALLAGLLTVLGASIVGTWVVLRGLTFLGDALAQGVLPGIAVAWALSVDPQLGALIAALAMVAGVNIIRSSSPLPDDVSLGILCVGFLALAVVLMSARGGFGDLNRFLFGSITGVDQQGIIRSAIFAVVTIVFATVGYRAMIMSTFDPAQAKIAGFSPRAVHFALLVMTALTVVNSFETVGSLLVFAFLIAPPTTASLLVKSVPRIIGLSIVLGALAAVIGLLISYHHRTAAGATMALVSVMLFFLGLISYNIRIRAVSA
ncbi:MAG: metal ABC transporter permease [Ilumatobacteraceae bacterium]